MARLCIVDEETYLAIPIMTRARMIAAEVGPKMVQALDQDRIMGKMRERSKTK